MFKVAMIPARMGSQRLKQKNLREIGGLSLIARAIRKAKASNAFDEIWVNSEHPAFGEIAKAEGVLFHQRPDALGGNEITSEDFVYEFLKSHKCDALFQVHSIAPLLTVEEIDAFVKAMAQGAFDTLLCYVPEQIECAMDNLPVNFNFRQKQNSQDLKPIQRIPWSITAWKAASYMRAKENGLSATYSGNVGFQAISRLGGHIIKTQDDLDIAEALLRLSDK
jgi:CMP-N-acetylneuraminic acid synthetase